MGQSYSNGYIYHKYTTKSMKNIPEGAMGYILQYCQFCQLVHSCPTSPTFSSTATSFPLLFRPLLKFPPLHSNKWRPFTQIYSTGVARVPTVVSGAFYYRLDVCNLCKLLFQTQFLSNYPTIIIFYLYNNIPQVNNKCIISCNHLLTCY